MMKDIKRDHPNGEVMIQVYLVGLGIRVLRSQLRVGGLP